MAKDAFLLRSSQKSLPPLKARIFPQDPLVASERPAARVKTIELPGEACIGVGPTTSRVAVVDYNADLDEVFEPAQLRKDGKGFVVGRRDPVENLRFHQVNVWAIITSTLNMLEDERVFGRRIPWAFGSGRLLVLPHAGYWENAFYDRATGALHFFYFEDMSGGRVYTCLSHDIVTHELGHAVLDGLKPYYNEVSSPSTAAFHEYFGDAIAMTSALSHRELVVEVAGVGVGDLSSSNLIANIAAQFGRAVGPDTYRSLADSYLRTGRNEKTMDDVRGENEEHLFSEVLTGAYYDLLHGFYESLIEQARSRGRKLDGGTRVRSLMNAAQIVARMALRAVDYCPPVDLTFADYARAMCRADAIAYPLDPANYRKQAARVFRKRRIVRSWTDLRRQRRIYNDQLRKLDVGVIGSSKTDAYDFVDANRLVLGIPPEVNLEIAQVYRTRKVSADGYRPPQEVIVEFVWSERVPLNDSRFGELGGTDIPLWCGGTLVFSRDGNLLHYALKDDTPERRKILLDYMAYLVRNHYISLDDGERGLGARAHGANVVSGRLSGGHLRMSRSAAFRHRT